MYTIKFMIGEQWRVYPANEFFYGHGEIQIEESGPLIKIKNTEIGTLIIDTIMISDLKKLKTGLKVFYILRFTDTGTVMLILDDDFILTHAVFIMQDGKTIDKL